MSSTWYAKRVLERYKELQKDGSNEILEWIWKEAFENHQSTPKSTESVTHLCHCPTVELMKSGCVCGGM